MGIDPVYSIDIAEMDAQWIRIIEKFRSVGSDHLADQAGFEAHTIHTPLRLNLLATIRPLEHFTQDDEKYAHYILGNKH